MNTLIRRNASVVFLPTHLLLRNLSSTSTNNNYFNCTGRNEGETGLYGFHLLKSPKGFQRFVDEAIQRSSELVSFVSNSPPSMDTIRAMDEISDTVCSVVDSAELCRNTHPDREFVEEATKASMRINEYLHFLNTNHTLYDAVVRVEKNGLTQTEEAHRAAHSLRVDFEKGGIHLSADKLQRVNELNIDIVNLCREFSENMIVDPGVVDIFPGSLIPKHIRHLLMPIYRSAPGTSKELLTRRKDNKEKGFRITTESSTLSSVLQWVSDDEVRKKSFIQGNSSPRANLGILDRLIAARHELAQIMGHKSFAEFSVHPNLASSPEVVISFLHELSQIVRPKADEEFNTIREFKRQRYKQTYVDLEPWDETYLTGKMRSSIYNLESSVISSYFPLSQCLEGLNVLVQSLFGATFCSIPLAPGESWHQDVLKMALHHPEEGDLGYLYLDLHSRKGKYPGCAHFAIKGGRRLSEMEYQLPVIALVCNFSAPPGSSVARLNHCEVETLFHEFGHALHSLLSRTVQKCAIAKLEVPRLVFLTSILYIKFYRTTNISQEPEWYYAWDYRVLKTFAKHYSTGEVIPEKLVESMKGAKKMFAATELQRQIFYALIDQHLFAEQSASPKDTISIIADLKRQYTSWKYVEGTHWHTRFNHLLNYGSGYYSYLYAKCFAATIWQEVCMEDPLSRAAGTTLRTKFLQHGGAKDPSTLLKDLAGDHILRYQKGGIMPNLTSVCKEMELINNPREVASYLLQKAS